MNEYERFLSDLENLEFTKLNLIKSVKMVMNNCSDICLDEKVFTNLNLETYELFIKGYAYLLSLEIDCEDAGNFFYNLFENDLDDYQIDDMCYYNQGITEYVDNKAYHLLIDAKYEHNKYWEKAA